MSFPFAFTMQNAIQASDILTDYQTQIFAKLHK